jgi:hypothetical protein
MRFFLSAQGAFCSFLFPVIALLIFGCASPEKMEAEISGTWQRVESHEAVTINLAKKPNSIEFDGKTYPATIERVDLGAYLVDIKVKTENGTEEAWMLRQVWDSSGSDFKLVFKHDGIQETLVHGKHT